MNNCHYESVTTKVLIPLYREIQGFVFLWFVWQIMDSNKCSFALFVNNANTCNFYWTRNNGCSKKFKLISRTKLKLQKGYEVVFRLFLMHILYELRLKFSAL